MTSSTFYYEFHISYCKENTEFLPFGYICNYKFKYKYFSPYQRLRVILLPSNCRKMGNIFGQNFDVVFLTIYGQNI